MACKCGSFASGGSCGGGGAAFLCTRRSCSWAWGGRRFSRRGGDASRAPALCVRAWSSPPKSGGAAGRWVYPHGRRRAEHRNQHRHRLRWRPWGQGSGRQKEARRRQQRRRSARRVPEAGEASDPRVEGAPVPVLGGQGQGERDEGQNPGGEEEDGRLEEHPTATRACHPKLRRPAQMEPLRRRRSCLAKVRSAVRRFPREQRVS